MSDKHPRRLPLIKRFVTLPDVLARYKVELRGLNGSTRVGRCPLPQHRSGSDSQTFKVWHGDKGWGWSCHSASCIEARAISHPVKGGLKKGGDLVDFVCCMEKCNTYQADELLWNWFGPFEDSAGLPEPKIAPVAQMATDETSAPNLPLKFELQGIQSRHEYLIRRGFEEEECEYLGVGFFGGKGSMSGRIVFPIHNEKGELVAYLGRATGSEEPRWKLPPNFRKGQVIYNLHRCISEWQCFVFEGPWGVLSAIRAGVTNAVATLGSDVTDAQVQMLSEFGRVVICFDNDSAGRNGAINLAERLSKAGTPRVEILICPTPQWDSLDPEKMRQVLGIPPESDYSLEVVADSCPPQAVPA